MKNKINQGFRFLLLVGILFIGLQIMNQGLILIGNGLSKIIPAPDYGRVFIIGIVQQGLQFGLAILLANLILNKKPAELGFNLYRLRLSFKYFGFFVLFIVVVILVYLWVSVRFVPQLWVSMRNTPLPTTAEMVTKILFQSIFPGLGEESLFRGFLISLLIYAFKPNLEKFTSKLWISITSGIFFAVAHIYFAVNPFTITHLDGTQLALAFSCGIAYSFMFIKTKSLVGPILSHNFSNVSMTIVAYLISAW